MSEDVFTRAFKILGVTLLLLAITLLFSGVLSFIVAMPFIIVTKDWTMWVVVYSKITKSLGVV